MLKGSTIRPIVEYLKVKTAADEHNESMFEEINMRVIIAVDVVFQYLISTSTGLTLLKQCTSTTNHPMIAYEFHIFGQYS